MCKTLNCRGEATKPPEPGSCQLKLELDMGLWAWCCPDGFSLVWVYCSLAILPLLPLERECFLHAVVFREYVTWASILHEFLAKSLHLRRL